MTGKEIIKVSSEAQVIEKLAELVEKYAQEAIAGKSSFSIGLSGGSLVKYLAAGLPHIQTDWSKWKLFFCDERYVPVDSADSTFGLYRQTLIPATSLTEEQFVQINLKLPLEECAVDYEKRIREFFHEAVGVPSFDLLLLGMGPDGHTCSLFPDHGLLGETSCLIAPISDSPKPPPERVTMTYPLLNAAKCCIFAMAGASKAEMVRRILKDGENLPAGRVQPLNGQLFWILDTAAASQL
uniref:6-phosphogluconolactonase n=1 Tax=Lutzomyia longipalpis TaxID=7200 RepID=A0A7G3AA34_LUTLO